MRSLRRGGSILTVVLMLAGGAQAAAIKVLHGFADTGQGTPSHYALGNTPYAELVQASDGNFYGTTVYGGSGLCPNAGQGGYTGCGTVFRMTPQGKVTALYSFPYNPATSIAANGAFPTAGLIQGKDGFLYGVAQDGGLGGCNGQLGCGTLFRISLGGDFKLLHQFCNGDGCANPTEGGRAMAHLVQLPNGSLCGTTAEGGIANNGTVFCASTDGTITTRFVFDNANYGDNPTSALLIGTDGETLYGTTAFGGPGGQGTVFALAGGQIAILHAFNFSSGDMSGNPECALIFGADGKLYGTTYGGNPAGVIFSLQTDGTGYTSQPVFSPEIAGRGFGPTSGLLLAGNGLMYGTTLDGGTGGDSGSAYSYDPVKQTYKTIASFVTGTGAAPRAALIEGADRYLYGTASLDGGSNARGADGGTVVRLSPALKP